MAHEIDMSNGRENMAYAGKLPWHGLGQQLSQDADLETWRREAGMDWAVRSNDVRFKDEAGAEHTMEDRCVLYRSDTKTALSVVSDNYKVVQPGEVMEFFRDLINDNGFRMETAGCLFGGRKFWALARTGENTRIMGQDEIAPYLLIATSCDGSMATAAHLTSVRVVCNNTLRMSIGSHGKLAKIRVPHSAVFDASLVKSQLGIVPEAWEDFIGNVTKLANFKIDRNEAIQIVADELKRSWVTDAGEAMSAEEQLASSYTLRRIIQLYDGAAMGAEFRSAEGTAWGLVNAVTQHFDHEAGATSGDRSRAFERANLTDRAKFKTNIADRLLEAA